MTQSVSTTSASASLELTPGKMYAWRVGAWEAGNLAYTEWSEPFTAATPANIAIPTGTDIDLGTGTIRYSNVYQTPADLPPAADYHGMFAHVHNYDGLGTGAAVYAHAGNWVRLADSDDVPTMLVSGINGLSGQIVLAAGAGTLISQAGNQLTISSTQTFTTLNGEAGALTLAAGDNVQISTQDGLIAISASDSSTVNGLTGNVSIVAGANINVATTGQNVVISGEQGGIQWTTPPQNSSAPGSPGDVAYDDNYLYLRTSQAWRQVPLQPISTAITISQQPQNTTVGDGGSATFTVLANAPEAISYQWSSSADGVSFAAINGATSNTLTINATLADNGSQYRALLSAAGAADVTTNIATLTVSETFRLLTANNDTLLTENGEVLNHDGVGGGGGGGNEEPTNDWEQSGVAFDTQGLAYAYSADHDIVFGTVATTSSSGYQVLGVQRHERINGTWTAVGNARSMGYQTAQQATKPLAVSASADGSRVIVVNNRSGVDTNDFSNAGYTVYEYASQALTEIYSGPPLNYELAAISGDGNTWAVYRGDGDVTVYSDFGPIGSAVGSVSLINTLQGNPEAYRQHLAINYDGTKVAFSSAGAYTRVFQWTGSSWAQIGGDFVSPSSFSEMSGRPVAFSSNGSRIAIGYSTDTDSTLTQCGVVRVYDWTGSAWVQAGSDLAGSAPYELFGSSLSLSSDGTRLAVGAIGDDSSATNSGRSVVYQYSAGEWFQIGTDIDGPASTNAYAGSSAFLSSDGNYLGVGASGAETLTRYGLQTNQITITQQPQDATYSGSPVTFSTSATVSDNSTPAYQWEYSADNGSTWAAISNATATNLTLDTVGLSDNGTQYRAVVSANRAPDATTDAATLTVSGNLIVQAAPQNITVAAGNDATFSATLEPAENWYVYDMKWERADSGSPNSWSAVETESLTGYDISSSSNVTQNYTWTSASAFDDGDLFRATGSAFEYGLAITQPGYIFGFFSEDAGRMRLEIGPSKTVMPSGPVSNPMVDNHYFTALQSGILEAKYYGVGDHSFRLLINGIEVETRSNNSSVSSGSQHSISAGDQVRFESTLSVFSSTRGGLTWTSGYVDIRFTPAAGLQETAVTSPPATLTVT